MNFIYMSSMKFIQTNQNEKFVLDDEKAGGKTVFASADEMDIFEGAIRDVLKERKDSLNLSDEAVGKIAFNFMTGKRTKIQAIFVGQGSGKNRNLQKLRLTDVMNLGEALGMTLAEVIKKANEKMKQ